MSGKSEGDAGGVLADLPLSLWGELLAAFRRAADTVGRAELPSRVRPFAGWKPDRLLAERPRRAIATALASDFQLRETVARELADEDMVAVAKDAPLESLVDGVGEELTAGLLVVHQRWSELAVLASEVANRMAAATRVAAEVPHDVPEEAGAEAAGLERALRKAQREAQDLRERLEAAERDSREREGEIERLRARITALTGEVSAVQQELSEERSRTRERLARMRRRVDDAESRVRAEAERVRVLSEQLAEATSPDRQRGSEAARARNGEPGRGSGVPRDVPAAEPGRPARLPVGLTQDSRQGVRALLRVPDLRLVVDGYNVTKNPAGRPSAELEDQRSWLIQLLHGVVGRHRVRATVVFDGQDVTDATGSRRGVQVLYSSPEETADERIIELVRDLPPDAPVLVVSSDREVQRGVVAAAANCCTAEVFLSAVRA